MEIDRRKSYKSSGDKFSFPIMMPNFDHFEFGSVTPPSFPDSPADHLFSNGKLLPHTYPLQSPNNLPYSRSSSCTSSKGSLMSSQSSSTNSRSSTSCSSARTSTSEVPLERRPPPEAGYGAGRREKIVRPAVMNCRYQYGSSQQWQLIAAVPVLKKQASSRSKKIDTGVDRKVEGCKVSKSWCGGRILKSFMSACKECHAIKT